MMFDWQPVVLSLKVASAALVLAFAAGTLAARWMAGKYFVGRELFEAIFLLPLVLPPVVTGYVLLVLARRDGVLGSWLESHGARLLFTPGAAVVASAVVAFPLAYQSARTAFEGVDPLMLDAARSLGATPARAFWSVAVPLSWPGLAAGAVLTFARALGEFGATILVAGNIDGQTTTVSSAIYMAAESGDLELAGKYSALLAAFNGLFILGVGLWSRRRHTHQSRHL